MRQRQPATLRAVWEPEKILGESRSTLVSVLAGVRSGVVLQAARLQSRAGFTAGLAVSAAGKLCHRRSFGDIGRLTEDIPTFSAIRLVSRQTKPIV